MKTKKDELKNEVDKKRKKKNKIFYWLFTGFIALGFLMSSFMYLSKNPALLENFSKTGFPLIFVNILGVAKLLGAIAIVNPWFPKLKEWAYAGFTFVLVGAVWVHIATNTAFVAPLVFLILLAVSYFFYQKIKSEEFNMSLLKTNSAA